MICEKSELRLQSSILKNIDEICYVIYVISFTGCFKLKSLQFNICSISAFIILHMEIMEIMKIFIFITSWSKYRIKRY